MRKVFIQNMVTLDGFFEGPNHEIDWHVVGEEFNDYALSLEASIDTFLFGRVTYDLMASYWPSEAGLRDDPHVANMMNSLNKVVFSRTLEKVDWINSRLVKDDPVQEVARLKQLPGKDMAIFGSADLAAALIPAGLIDEFRIFINPIVLGAGNPMFKGLKKRLPLKLVSSRTFQSGIVLLVYQTV
jgi:dihydrofolate reductase